MKSNNSVLKPSFYRVEGNFFMKNLRSSLYKYKMVPSIQNENFSETEANNDITNTL